MPYNNAPSVTGPQSPLPKIPSSNDFHLPTSARSLTPLHQFSSSAPYESIPKKNSQRKLTAQPHPGDPVVLEQPYSRYTVVPEYDNPVAQSNAITPFSRQPDYFPSHRTAASLDLAARWKNFQMILIGRRDVTNMVLDQMVVLVLTQSPPNATSHTVEQNLFYHLHGKLFHEHGPEAQVMDLLDRMLPAAQQTHQYALVDADMVHLFMNWVGIVRGLADVTLEELCDNLSGTHTLHDLNKVLAILSRLGAAFSPVLFGWLLSLTGALSSNNVRGYETRHVSRISPEKASPYLNNGAAVDSATVPMCLNTSNTGLKSEHSGFGTNPSFKKWKGWMQCLKKSSRH